MKNTFFIEGAIHSNIISENIDLMGEKENMGAHSMFLGQVRNDIIDGKQVKEIIYTAYNEMAENEADKLISFIKEKYNDVNNIIVKHSIGSVKAGKLSLFVMVTGGHRVQARNACNELVDLIKDKVPIWGKEAFTDDSYTWKENK